MSNPEMKNIDVGQPESETVEGSKRFFDRHPYVQNGLAAVAIVGGVGTVMIGVPSLVSWMHSVFSEEQAKVDLPLENKAAELATQDGFTVYAVDVNRTLMPPNSLDEEHPYNITLDLGYCKVAVQTRASQAEDGTPTDIYDYELWRHGVDIIVQNALELEDALGEHPCA